jgi:hypothetical protein
LGIHDDILFVDFVIDSGVWNSTSPCFGNVTIGGGLFLRTSMPVSRISGFSGLLIVHEAVTGVKAASLTIRSPPIDCRAIGMSRSCGDHQYPSMAALTLRGRFSKSDSI